MPATSMTELMLMLFSRRHWNRSKIKCTVFHYPHIYLTQPNQFTQAAAMTASKELSITVQRKDDPGDANEKWNLALRHDRHQSVHLTSTV